MTNVGKSLGAQMSALIKRGKRTSLVTQLESELYRAECPDDVRLWICAKAPKHVQKWLHTLLENITFTDPEDEDEGEDEDEDEGEDEDTELAAAIAHADANPDCLDAMKAVEDVLGRMMAQDAIDLEVDGE